MPDPLSIILWQKNSYLWNIVSDQYRYQNKCILIPLVQQTNFIKLKLIYNNKENFSYMSATFSSLLEQFTFIYFSIELSIDIFTKSEDFSSQNFIYKIYKGFNSYVEQLSVEY